MNSFYSRRYSRKRLTEHSTVKNEKVEKPETKLTNYRMIFLASRNSEAYPDYCFHVPLNTIAKVTKNNSNGSLNPGQILNKSQTWWIELECKDLRTVRLEFDEHEVEARNQARVLNYWLYVDPILSKFIH